MILEMMRFKDAFNLCYVLGIVEEVAFRYHSFYPIQYYIFSSEMLCNYVNKIYDFEKRKVVNPNLAKAMLKNSSFQSLADANEKVKYSILSQDIDLVRDALKNLNSIWKAKYTIPLQIACKFGQLAVVKLLFNDYGIDIDNISFVYACEEGHDDIVKYIISHPKFKLDRWITDPLMQWGNTTVIRCLLAEERFDPSLRNNQAIIEASCRGNGETVKLLLADPRVDPSVQDNRALIMAARYAQVETVKLLLADPKVNPGDQHNQGIINAAQRDALDIVRILKADPRVNPADQNNQAIINAAEKDHLEILKLLLADPRVDPSDQNNQAFIRAAQYGRVEIVKVLQSDPRVNPADQNNQAIIHAVTGKRIEIVEMLLADPRVDPSAQENRAIVMAAHKGII